MEGNIGYTEGYSEGTLSMSNYHGARHGIGLKKKYGQHFLHDQSIVDSMLAAVDVQGASIFEIGCGDGFLTRSLLTTGCSRLWIFEIDEEWVQYVRSHYPDKRMTVFHENILTTDFSRFEPYKPWTLLANLPYQVTFPILTKIHENRSLIKEGVVMVQEEVAQKIVKTSGRGYGVSSLFFQHYFSWKLLTKVPPAAFYPPPKVHSRLLYFKPIEPKPIVDEAQFWIFAKRCFSQPRRTLKNNLHSYHYDLSKFSENTNLLRAQELSMDKLLELWELVRPR